MELGLASSGDVQVELPMGPGSGDAPIAEVLADPKPAAEETDALKGVLTEVLYEIPGYSAEGEFQPAKGRLESLSIAQLILIGVAGLGLLGAAFYPLMRGAASSGVVMMAFDGLAALAGLSGAILTFTAVYQLLNRFDRES